MAIGKFLLQCLSGSRKSKAHEDREFYVFSDGSTAWLTRSEIDRLNAEANKYIDPRQTCRGGKRGEGTQYKSHR